MKVKLNREKVATLLLMAGTFFNPLGYDALLFKTIELTGSYWISISIFYLLAACCFTAYFFVTKINPLKWFKRKKNKKLPVSL